MSKIVIIMNNFKQAKEIYMKIAKANGFYIYPWLTLYDSAAMNASCKVFWIRLYQGALDGYNEHELALTLGHELAHLRFRHIFGITDAYEKEYEADRIGAEYMIKAGYDINKGMRKFKKWGKRPISETHPSPRDRYNTLKAIYSA